MASGKGREITYALKVPLGTTFVAVDNVPLSFEVPEAESGWLGAWRQIHAREPPPRLLACYLQITTIPRPGSQLMTSKLAICLQGGLLSRACTKAVRCHTF